MSGDLAVGFLHGLLDARKHQTLPKFCLSVSPLFWAIDGGLKKKKGGFFFLTVSEDFGGFQSCELAQNCFVSTKLFLRHNINPEKSGYPRVSPGDS